MTQTKGQATSQDIETLLFLMRRCQLLEQDGKQAVAGLSIDSLTFQSEPLLKMIVSRISDILNTVYECEISTASTKEGE